MNRRQHCTWKFHEVYVPMISELGGTLSGFFGKDTLGKEGENAELPPEVTFSSEFSKLKKKS